MTPSAVFAIGVVLCGVLLVGSCAGRVVDLRWPGWAGRFGVCSAFVVVLGVTVVESSGVAAFGEVLSHTKPGTGQEFAAFIGFVAAGTGAMLIMTLGQFLALISGLRTQGGRLWLVGSVLAVIASLALMWSSLKTLQQLFGPVLRLDAILAPTVGGAVITALLLARAIAYQLASREVSPIGTSSPGDEPEGVGAEQLPVAPDAAGHAKVSDGRHDQARYRRPGVG